MIAANPSYRGEGLADSIPQFKAGQLVRHRRYGYRGVVVAFDGHCTAEEAWYLSNKTQPERGQCWYHVFVHESSTVTYAAEENLTEDSSDLPIEHPLVPAFFSAFENGQYIRNDVDWPV